MFGLLAALFTIGAIAFQAYSVKKEAEQQEQYNLQQAEIAHESAKAAKQRTEYEANLREIQGRRLLSKQRASAAVSGATLDSFKRVFAQSITDTELDVLAIRTSGNAEAKRYKSEEEVYKGQAASVKKAGKINLGRTLLGGAKQLMDVWA